MGYSIELFLSNISPDIILSRGLSKTIQWEPIKDIEGL